MNLPWQITEYKNALMRPIYLSSVSAWHGHVPFAFFITELLKPKVFVELGVHAADSYFAFCQGLDAVGPPSKAFGVDTFMGDEHSGAYAQSVYPDVAKMNAEMFPFSTILKERFETACEKFEDGEINLLHLDGCHTYEAVSRDVEMWLPKMATNGVMLLHDTVVREGGFGVWERWEKMKKTFPCYDFFHSNGLGMALVGPEQPDLLTGLCHLSTHSEGEWARAYFELLAERVNAIRMGRESN